MRKILLLNPPLFENKKFNRSGYCNSVSKGGYYWGPIDLLVQSGVLKEKFDLTIVDATGNGWHEERTIQYLKKFKSFDGLFFITSLASRDNDFRFIKKLKNEISIKNTLVSGGYLLYNHSEIFENNIADGVLLDYTSDETINFFELGVASEYKTVSIPEKRKIINDINSDLQVEFEYPVPLHFQFPIKNYYMPTCNSLPMATIITNLGCPFKCDFCTWSPLKYRFRKIENTIEEIKFLVENGVNEIMFIDPTFGANKSKTKHLLKEIIKNNLKIEFSVESRVDLITDEFSELLSRAGCHSITFGLESGNDEILKNIEKGFNTSTIRRAFKICHKYKIAPTGHFIIGLPGETKDTINDTINLAKEIDCDFASFNIIMALPGTKIFEELSSNGKIESCSDITKPVSVSGDLTPDEILNYSIYAFKKFYLRPYYIFKTLLKFINITRIKIILKEFYFMINKFIK